MKPVPVDSCQFVDAFLVHGNGGDLRPAVVTRTGGRWEAMTGADLACSSAGVARALVERGVEPGDRVVLAGEAGGAWVAALLGTLRCGAVAVPLDPGLTPSERQPMVEKSAPAAVLGPGEVEELTAGNRGGAEAPGVARSLDEAAMIVWTSGTTGAPKGVTLSFANLSYSVGQVMAGQRPSAADRWLSVLPAHHLLELCCGVLPALASGGTIRFARSLMPHELAGIIREHGITKMVAVPLLLRILEGVVAGSGIGTIYCGGAPLGPDVVERYAARGIAVYAGYGLTEAAPTVAMNTPEHQRAGSVGRPLTGTDVRIAHPAGDGAGEILVRSPAVMQGYWRDEALTSAVIDAEGWLHTGDLGFVDDDGFLFVTGRAKRLVVLESGKNVQPEEVEGVIAASDLFTEVCVVGVAASRRGAAPSERVCAVVVPNGALAGAHPDPARLQEAVEAEVARCTSSLSGYKRPTMVRVHHGALPRTLKGEPRHTEVARMVENGVI